MERVASLVRSLRAEGLDIRYVDAGGGLGISYDQDPSDSNFSSRGKTICPSRAPAAEGVGSSSAAGAGTGHRGTGGRVAHPSSLPQAERWQQFVVVDAAMNDLLRPSLYGAYHEIVPVVLRKGSMSTEKVDVVGPVCETGDFFARDRMIHGDARRRLLVAILDTGAYGMVAGVELQHAPAASRSAGGRRQVPSGTKARIDGRPFGT